MVLTVGAFATRQGFSPPFLEKSHLYLYTYIVLARIPVPRMAPPGACIWA